MGYISSKNFAGYETYSEYLKSDIWSSIRSKKLHHNPHCELCRDIATQVHHFAYGWNILVGDTIVPLVSACRSCHLEIEFTSGRKLSLRDSQEKLIGLMLDRGMFGRAKSLGVFIRSKDRLRAAAGKASSCGVPRWNPAKVAKAKKGEVLHSKIPPIKSWTPRVQGSR